MRYLLKNKAVRKKEPIIIEGVKHSNCSICLMTLPYSRFYLSKYGSPAARCKNCISKINSVRYTKHNTPGRFVINEYNQYDIEISKELLTLLGYDISRNIHEQFMERHKDKF